MMIVTTVEFISAGFGVVALLIGIIFCFTLRDARKGVRFGVICIIGGIALMLPMVFSLFGETIAEFLLREHYIPMPT